MDTRMNKNNLKRKLNDREEEMRKKESNFRYLEHEMSNRVLMYTCVIQKQEKKEEELKAKIITLKNDLSRKSFDKDLCQAKILKQQKLVELLKDKLECAVCLDVPRSIPVPVCQNGHFVCQKCKTESCPTCRTAMGAGRSLLANAVLENINHKCKYQDCSSEFPLSMIEEHEAACPNRIVKCPDAKCGEEVPLGKLVAHLTDVTKDCFAEMEPVKIFNDEWNSVNYQIGDVLAQDPSWPVHICEYSGEFLVVLPIKSEGLFYFVVLMFANRAECSKYTFEMIVHESGSEALDSMMSVKFRGNPLSIDAKKEEWNLYGTNVRLMAKLVEESVDKSSIRLSFRISEFINVV